MMTRGRPAMIDLSPAELSVLLADKGYKLAARDIGWSSSGLHAYAKRLEAAGLFTPPRQSSGRGRSTVPHALQELAEAGLTLNEIATKLGLTREQVSNRLRNARLGPLWTSAVAAKARIAQADEDLTEVLEAMQSAVSRPPCLVCGCWVIRRTGQTCSTECAALWKIGRYQISDDARQRQRLASARTMLRHPERYKPSQRRWAADMLSDSPPEPNRRYQVRASGAKEAAAVAARLCPTLPADE